MGAKPKSAPIIINRVSPWPNKCKLQNFFAIEQ